MKPLICLLAILPMARLAAHVGLENTTDIRLHADRMEIVTRTSPMLAWALLGPDAPAGYDAAGQEAALPLLRQQAARLLDVMAAEQQMVPLKTDCQFEVEDDIAFTLVFPRPTTWPVTIRTGFTHLLGEMDRGTVSFYDHTEAGYRRDIDPTAVRSISRRHPKASFQPVAISAPPVTMEVPEPPKPGRTFWPVLIMVSVSGAVLLTVCFRWNHTRAM
ncbi:MAG: hypothetical protein EOP85_01925 [Verrucomicrobiaceae bacterium]|nr:MAG: hypothetical protein EOP85_01925 [Verrucomicrobiaceae bacterium]